MSKIPSSQAAPGVLPPTPLELLRSEAAPAAAAPRSLVKTIIGYPFRRQPRCASFAPGGAREGVLLSGELEKWTNYIGMWKLRQFEIIPGVLCVYSSDGPKDHVPLMTCTIKSVKQLEVTITRTDGAPLKLRFPTARLRSQWLSVAAKAKQLASPSRCMPIGFYTASEAEADGMPSPFLLDEEGIAITNLLESVARTQAAYTTHKDEMDLISRRLLDILRDASQPTKELLTSLLIEQHRLDATLHKHFVECHAAIRQEQKERNDLQQCLRREARENYKLGHKLLRVPRAHTVGSALVSRRGSATADEFYDLEDMMSSSEESVLEEEGDPQQTTTSASVTEMEEDEEDERGESYCEDSGLARVWELLTVGKDVGEWGLPRPACAFRTRLPKPRTEIKTSVWSLLKDFVGKDLSRIALPVTFNEPTSFLQRMAEDYQYCQLLEKAASLADPVDRLLVVALFTITPWQSAVGRTYKPFNPLLGETYELTHMGFMFQAEQVGHHPPVTAYHAKGKAFEGFGHIIIDTKFTGKSLEVHLNGPITIKLSLADDTTETYSYRRPRMMVNNIIFGRISLDVVGTYTITNHSTGDFAVIDYPRTGWWDDSSHVVRAAVFRRDGECVYRISGNWSTQLFAQEVRGIRVGPHTADSASVVLRADLPGDSDEVRYPPRPIDFSINWKQLEAHSTNTKRLMWQAEPRPEHSGEYYSFGRMTFELNDLNPEYYELPSQAPMSSCDSAANGEDETAATAPDDGKRRLLATDSRLRPDQAALEQGDMDRSNAEKKRLEEKQRAAARSRGGSEENYAPRWYTPSIHQVTGEPTYAFDAESYWDPHERARRVPDIL